MCSQHYSKEDTVPEMMLVVSLLSQDIIFQQSNSSCNSESSRPLQRVLVCIHVGDIIIQAKTDGAKTTWEKGQTHKLLYIQNKARLKRSTKYQHILYIYL